MEMHCILCKVCDVGIGSLFGSCAIREREKSRLLAFGVLIWWCAVEMQGLVKLG